MVDGEEIGVFPVFPKGQMYMFTTCMAFCGCYFLLNDLGDIVYIGRSVNVIKRIREHERDGLIEFYYFALCVDKKPNLSKSEQKKAVSASIHIESELIKCFNPIYNKNLK
jgi:excinuclease UvrABC nuclease subunit